MEPEGSLPRLQVPATCPYPERLNKYIFCRLFATISLACAAVVMVT